MPDETPTGQRPRHPRHHDYAHDLPESGLEIVLDPGPDLTCRRSPAEDVSAGQLSLSQRLRDPRTIVSSSPPRSRWWRSATQLTARGFDFEHAQQISAGKPAPAAASRSWCLLPRVPVPRLAVAFCCEGHWQPTSRVRDSTEIMFISWLVNCVVPAKLGDVYRAYLLRLNFDVSLSRTFGTVFIERVFDLFAIVLLGLAAGFVSFRNGLTTEVQLIFGLGVVLVVLLAVGLFLLRNFGRRLLTRLPLPAKVLDFYDRFEEGVFSIKRRDVVELGALTAFIWGTEALRLVLVIEALGFNDLHLGISGARFFVALAASLLTAIPLTPAGLGVVEAGVIGILTVIYDVPPTEATAIALVDRAISVLSIIVLGSIAYILSPKTKGGPRKPATIGAPA